MCVGEAILQNTVILLSLKYYDLIWLMNEKMHFQLVKASLVTPIGMQSMKLTGERHMLWLEASREGASSLLLP